MTIIKSPQFKLTLGTSDFESNELKPLVHLIVVEQNSDSASSFKIELDDADDTFSTGKVKIQEGDACEVEMGFAEENSMTKLISGKVTGVRINRKDGGHKIFEVSGFDGMQDLTRERKRRSWENIKDSDIASSIASEVGLGSDVDDSSIVHPYVVQNNINNLSFLYERAKRIGFEVKVVDKTLVFKKAQRLDPEVTLSWKEGGDDVVLLKKMNFDTTTMNVVNKVVVRSYDPKSGKAIVASSSDQKDDGGKTGAQRSTIGNNGSTIQISDQPVYSTEEAEALANAELNARSENYLTGRGTCWGNPKVCAGKTVGITEVGAEMDGTYYVKTAVHKFEGGIHGRGYFTTFSVSRVSR